MTARKTVEAWHFAPAGMTTRYDGRPIVVGKTLTVAGPVAPCERGLHASERIIDALEYSPSEAVALCRVKLGGEIVPHGNPPDKLAATRRTCLWALDGDTTNRMLRVFAQQCALDVIHLWQAPEFVRYYLETGDETIRVAAWAAARDAARDAAGDAAWAAAWAAARDAAGDAAWAAAWAAARDAARDAAGDAARAAARAAAGAAAWDAARAAARDAAWDAARDAAWAAARDVARDAAWAAARDVARDAQNERLTALAWAAHNGEPLGVVLPAGYVAVTR